MSEKKEDSVLVFMELIANIQRDLHKNLQTYHESELTFQATMKDVMQNNTIALQMMIAAIKSNSDTVKNITWLTVFGLFSVIMVLLTGKVQHWFP